MNTVIFEGPPAPKTIYLYLIGEHYAIITSMPRFVRKAFYCETCLVGYENLRGHTCSKTCKFCLRTDGCEKSVSQQCPHCPAICSNSTCLKRHILRCKNLISCTTCGKTHNKNLLHQCYAKYCRTCRTIMPMEHVCFMRKMEVKLRPTQYIFFDFECRFVTEGEIMRHEPNFCVASKPCLPCIDDYNPDCPNCVRKIFRDNDSFCRWLINEEHAGCVAISHNFSGYDGQFIMQYCVKNGMTPDVIMNGRKILSLKVNDINFIDSLNFFIAPLSALPKTFGLTDEAKGYFPYLFNVKENEFYEGNVPESHYYDPDGMRPEERARFLSWHAQQDGVFNMQNELEKYCRQDVNILEQCCLRFRKLFLADSGIDPFQKCLTISQCCNKVFLSKYLKPNTIELLTPSPVDRHSISAIRYLKWIEHSENISIRHARNGREVKIDRYKVDGICGNRVWEFNGCIFHGHSCIRDRTRKVPGRDHITMEEADRHTHQKKADLEKLGFVVHSIYECEFKNMLKANPEMKTFIESLEIPERLDPRQALYGGRTNAFKLFHEIQTGEQIRYVDIRSLYPYAMRKGRYPVGAHEVILEKFNDISTYEGIAHCRVLPPRGLMIPVLPYRSNGKLLFPLCAKCADEMLQTTDCQHSDRERSLTGTWVTLEIQEALRCGYVVLEIFEVWHYAQTSTYDSTTKSGGLFTDYVNHFYKCKLEADGYPSECNNEAAKERYVRDMFETEGIALDPENIARNNGVRAIAKLSLNSMYGKLAQRPNMTSTKFISEPKIFFDLLLDESKEIQSVDFVTDEVIRVSYNSREEFIETPGNTNVILAAYVTTIGRLTLLDYLRQGEKSLLYCDTDSMFFVHPQSDIATSPYLGGMVDELAKDYGVGSHITRFCSGGPKNYAYEVKTAEGETKSVVKVRGITLNYRASNIITLPAVERLVKYRDSYVVTEPHKIVRLDDAEIISRRESKTYRFVYNKRVLLPSFDTLPYGF